MLSIMRYRSRNRVRQLDFGGKRTELAICKVCVGDLRIRNDDDGVEWDVWAYHR